MNQQNHNQHQHQNHKHSHKQDVHNHKEQRDTGNKETKQQSFPYLAFVSFKASKKIYTFGTDSIDYKVGDQVIVETVRGLEVGEIVKECETYINHSSAMSLKPIVRKAKPKDIKDAEANVQAAKDAMVICGYEAD